MSSPQGVSVRIPTPLRGLTAGAGEVRAHGETVREVVASLETAYPGVAARLIDETGAVRRFVNLYVGDDDVRHLDGLDTEVADGAVLSIVPAVAGG